MLENAMVIDELWTWVDEMYCDCDDEPELVEDLLSVDDDDRDCYEGAFGAMDKVDLDILKSYAEIRLGRKLESAEWNNRFDCIVVTYYDDDAA